jgi:hypothetical protein
MHKLVPVLMLIATAPIALRVSAAGEMRWQGPLSGPSVAGSIGPNGVVLIGGMGGGSTGGGMTGGGMTGGGMTGGGMGGMTGGGMTGGGMGGMTGGTGGMPGNSMGGITGGGMTGGGRPGDGVPSSGVGQPYGGGETSGGDAQQYYHCITQHGQCTVASTPGSLRHGVSCSCLKGGPGKIK